MKRSGVFLMHGDAGAFYDSPYVDANGETDNDMRRHKPLYLNQARYERLQNIYASQGLPAEIARLQDPYRVTNWRFF